jgi:hypothetical protein
MIRRSLLSPLVLAFVLHAGLACEPEDAPGPSSERPNGETGQLAQKCEAYAAAVCTKEAACDGAAGTPASCVKDAIGPGRFDCGRVSALSADFETCLRDIPQGACPPALPASCKEALRYDPVPSGGGGSGGSGRGGSGGPVGNYRCDASGVYAVCDRMNVCMTHVVDAFGFGPTEAEAGASAQKSCADYMLGLVTLNNITSYAYVGVQCRVISCRPQ